LKLHIKGETAFTQGMSAGSPAKTPQKAKGNDPPGGKRFLALQDGASGNSWTGFVLRFLPAAWSLETCCDLIFTLSPWVLARMGAWVQ